MKVTNWCRKLSAAIVAGGLMTPCPVHAAGLATNLLANPGFELVDTTTAGVYSGVKILNWVDGSSTGFAYNYGQAYDFGGPLAGGGTYYFTSNQSGGTNTDVTSPGVISQSVDVSTGATATAIASGSATFSLSAFFTSYANPTRPALTDGDIGNIQVAFRNAANGDIGSIVLSDPNPLLGWKQASTSGLVPVGTAKLFVSLYGTPVTFGPDGYLDNLDLRIVPEPSTVILVGLGGLAVLALRRRE